MQGAQAISFAMAQQQNTQSMAQALTNIKALSQG